MMNTHASPSPRRQALIVLIGSVAVTLGMWLLPSAQGAGWLLAPFNWLEIYVHEFGHGIAALISGGQFDKFEMWTYSGVATTAPGGGAFARAFLAAGGLCGPAVVGGLFLAMGRNAKLARVGLALFGAFMVVSLVLWTRTAFGWGFGAVVALIALGVALRGSASLAQIVLVFLGVQLALSVYTGGGYLFMSEAHLQNGMTIPSDTQQMANAIGMTYWFWGAVCAAFSAAALVAGLWVFMRRGRGARAAAVAI
jgi:hypothetical protein